MRVSNSAISVDSPHVGSVNPFFLEIKAPLIVPPHELGVDFKIQMTFCESPVVSISVFQAPFFKALNPKVYGFLG